MAEYRVVAPLIQVKLKDAAGADIFQHFYQGAVLPKSADAEQLKMLQEDGLVEKASVEPLESAVTPSADEPKNVPGDPQQDTPLRPSPRAKS